MDKFMWLTFFTSFLISCSGQKSGLLEQSAHAEVTKHYFPACQAGGDAMSCLRRACAKVNGELQSTGECVCPRGGVFTAWNGGECLSLQAMYETSDSSHFGETFVAELNYPTDETRETRDLGSPTGNISLLNPSLHFNLRDWVTARPPETWDLGLAVMPHLGMTLRIVVGHSFNEDTFSKLDLSSLLSDSPILFDQLPLSQPQIYTRMIYAKDLKQLARIVGVAPPENQAPALSSFQFETLGPWSALAREAAFALESQRTPDSTEFQSLTDNGCAGICISQSVWSLPSGKVQLERRWVGGVIFEERLKALSGPNGVREPVPPFTWIFAPHHELSLLVKEELKENQNSIWIEINSYTPEGHALHQSWNRTLISDRDSWLMAKNESESLRLVQPQRAVAVVCEDGFRVDSSAWDREMRKKLISGPHPEESEWGWISREGLSIAEKMSGVLGLSTWGIATQQKDMESHTLAIFENLTEDDNVSAIPIGTQECFTRVSAWRKSVHESKALSVRKTLAVNFSGAYKRDPQACKESRFAQAVLSSDRDTLWVLAGGNDGKEISPSSHVNCPQSLSGRSNVLTVGFGSRRQVFPGSSRGTQAVDLIADGGSSFTHGASSSAAAPRVTAVAARLTQRFPNLSPEQVRLAILLGVEIPTSLGRLAPLPVRSGGYLDEETSSEFADLLSKRGATLPDSKEIYEMIRTVYCVPGKETQCLDRFRFLKGTGVL